MKLICDRQALLGAVGLVSSVVPARSPKSALQCVKLIGSSTQGCTLMATDLEVGIRHSVEGVTVEEPGSALLNAQRLQSILRANTGEKITILSTEDKTELHGTYADYDLPSEDPDQFPDPPDFAARGYHIIAAKDLRRLIKRTIFATDVESTRYALGGVLVELGEGKISLVGTDGRRLAKADAEAQAENLDESEAGQPVLPVKALKLLERNLDDQDPPVQLAIQGSAAALARTGRSVIYTRLVEGRFPRYQDVFPRVAEVSIDVEVGPFLSVIEQASIITSDESRGVVFHFGPALLSLYSQATDIGKSTIQLPIEYSGKPIAITFDPRYLSDALKNLEPDLRLAIELVDARCAVVFRSQDGYLYVVMPLNQDKPPPAGAVASREG